MLHASELKFTHPFTREELVLKAGFDETWQRLMSEFNWSVEE
jgi:tRNA pseudouridine65 synthase